MSAVIYARISDDRAGAGLGVARQETDCRALCASHGWPVDEVLVDNDRSAYSGRRRPGYERLLAGLKDGTWDVVLAWHPDRLHRSPKELEAFIDVLEASGAQVHTVTAGTLDLSTPTGRMTARVVGAVARHESEHKAERQRRKHRELAEAGRDVGGGRAFGWQADRQTLDPVEATLVREAAQRLLDGGTLRGIVADWEARGIRPVKGDRWNSYVIRRLLLAPRVAGFRSYAGRLHRATWEPIVDEVTWRRLCALLGDPGRRAATSSRSYLLTGGLARCGLCDAKLVARPKVDHRRCYVCASGPMFNGCGKIRILAEAFEDDVVDRVHAAINADRIPAPQSAGVAAAVLAEIEGVEARLAELADDYYVHRTVSKPQFQSAGSQLNTRLAALRSQAGQLERSRTAGVDRSTVDRWEQLSIEAQRAVVAAVADAVIVAPAIKGQNFYRPQRVTVRWRV